MFTPDEQAAFDSVQAEKAALGIVDEPKVEEDEVVTPKEDETTQPTTTQDPDDESVNSRKHIPIKEYIDLKKDLKAELSKERDEFSREKQELLSKIEELSKTKPTEEQTAYDLEQEAKQLAEELEVDPEMTKKILDRARKGLGLSEEDKQALASIKDHQSELQQLRAEKLQREEQQAFDTRWSEALKDIKGKFPNASDEQISKAKEEMVQLSKSDKYKNSDLDYIFFKENENFGKILFSPKQKTFERGTQHQTANDVDSNDISLPANFANMTPAQQNDFITKRDALISSMPSEKLRITETDGMGNLIERFDG